MNDVMFGRIPSINLVVCPKYASIAEVSTKKNAVPILIVSTEPVSCVRCDNFNQVCIMSGSFSGDKGTCKSEEYALVHY